MKICTRCKAVKPLAEFYKNRSQPDGLSNQCKACARDVQREIYLRDPAKYKAKSKEYLSKHGPEHNKRRRLNRREIYIVESARRYGSSPDKIRKLLEIVNCEICGLRISFNASNVHERPNIDHCHATGKVRGLLCGYCNNMLGRVKDNPLTLMRAVQYLNERNR